MSTEAGPNVLDWMTVDKTDDKNARDYLFFRYYEVAIDLRRKPEPVKTRRMAPAGQARSASPSGRRAGAS